MRKKNQSRIIYTLYSEEDVNGTELAVLRDQAQAYVMEDYFKRSYNSDRFLVTVKQARQAEEVLIGEWNKGKIPNKS